MKSLLSSGGTLKQDYPSSVQSIPSGEYAGGIANGLVNAAVQEARELTSLDRASQVMVEQRERVSALVHELEKRLTPFLRAVPPSPTTGNAQAQVRQNTSMLVEGLFNQAALIKQIGDHLEQIIDRVEL